MPRLRELRDEAALRAAKSLRRDAPSLEWALLSREHKIIFLMLAGIDGEVEDIALRDWLEFTPPETVAIQLAMRSMKRSLDGVVALVRR